MCAYIGLATAAPFSDGMRFTVDIQECRPMDTSHRTKRTSPNWGNYDRDHCDHASTDR